MDDERPAVDGERLPIVTARELSRHPAEVLDRARRGERLIVSRHGKPVATLQPLDGVVVQPFTGQEFDVRGSPLGDVNWELDKLSEIQRQILARCVHFDKILLMRLSSFHDFSALVRAAEDLKLRGLVRRCDRGLVVTGRGLTLSEALVAREGRSLS